MIDPTETANDTTKIIDAPESVGERFLRLGVVYSNQLPEQMVLAAVENPNIFPTEIRHLSTILEAIRQGYEAVAMKERPLAKLQILTLKRPYPTPEELETLNIAVIQDNKRDRLYFELLTEPASVPQQKALEKLVRHLDSIFKITKQTRTTRQEENKKPLNLTSLEITIDSIENLAEDTRVKEITELRELVLGLYLEKQALTKGLDAERLKRVFNVIGLSPEKLKQRTTLATNLGSYLDVWYKILERELGVTEKHIHSPRKTRNISFGRTLTCFTLRENIFKNGDEEQRKLSFPQIGAMLGGKNHATVILSCRKVGGRGPEEEEYSFKPTGKPEIDYKNMTEMYFKRHPDYSPDSPEKEILKH
jgi:hypothetical protein